MSNAGEQPNPSLSELPDDLDADAFVRGDLFLVELYRRYPNKTPGQVKREFLEAIDRGDLHLKYDDGNIVARPRNGYNGRCELNADGIFEICQVDYRIHAVQ